MVGEVTGAAASMAVRAIHWPSARRHYSASVQQLASRGGTTPHVAPLRTQGEPDGHHAEPPRYRRPKRHFSPLHRAGPHKALKLANRGVLLGLLITSSIPARCFWPKTEDARW
jgi:hypothetical protein